MFLVAWFWDVLRSLGLADKKARLVLLGLDNAGKTTLLHMLRDNRMVAHVPTHHPTNEELRMGGITFNAYDLGGHKEAREMWDQYYEYVDAIIYMVDASDAERLPESRKALEDVLMHTQSALVPLLVLGNKVDRDGALSEPQFREALGLTLTSGKHGDALGQGERPHEVFMCSIAERHGYREGFEWLAKYI